MASDDKKRLSVALPTIQESDEDLNTVLDDVHRSTRRKRECRTPSKVVSAEKSAPSSGSRQRTPRHSADKARQKLANMFNPGDKYGRTMYPVSESGSEESSDSYQPALDEEIMPKGECNISF